MWALQAGLEAVRTKACRQTMQVATSFADVHGAGAQRCDPKVGDPARFPHGHGPQGDVIRIYNFVRLVRGGLD